MVVKVLLRGLVFVFAIIFCNISNAQRLKNGSGSIIGYIENGRVKNSSGSIQGYIDDGRVKNSSGSYHWLHSGRSR